MRKINDVWNKKLFFVIQWWNQSTESKWTWPLKYKKSTNIKIKLNKKKIDNLDGNSIDNEKGRLKNDNKCWKQEENAKYGTKMQCRKKKS